MSTRLVFDFGTTSLKVAYVEDDEITAERNGDYPVVNSAPGWAEQDPNVLWSTAGQLSRLLVEERGGAEAIDEIVFVAPWKGVIPIGDDGRVLHSAVIWLDGRADNQAAALNTVLSSQGSPTRLNSQDYLARLAWFKENRAEVWSSARWIMGMNTFIKYMATGVVVTEPSDDYRHHTRDPMNPNSPEEALRDVVLSAEDAAKFPATKPADHIIGELTPEACEHFGVSQPANVINGFGDLPAIAAGVGPVTPGATHIYVGTSSWLGRITDNEAAGKHDGGPPATFRFDEETEVELYPLQTGAMAFDWIVEELYGHERAHLRTDFLDHINKIIDAVPPGSDNLLATHWLNGELPPFSKAARGVFINLNTTHGKAHMVRAMMESICYTHRLSIEQVESRHGLAMDSVRVVGGGATSGVWMQIMADVLGRKVIVPTNPRYAGILGGLKCITSALTGAGIREGFEAEITEHTTVYQPSVANKAVYDRLFSVYKKLHPSLEDIFKELNTGESTKVNHS